MLKGPVIDSVPCRCSIAFWSVERVPRATIPSGLTVFRVRVSTGCGRVFLAIAASRETPGFAAVETMWADRRLWFSVD